MTAQPCVDDLSYRDAVTELESILDRLEHDEPDVDLVAVDVARAGELVAHCHDRIATARLRVEEVVARLGPAMPAGDGGAEPASAPDDGSAPR
ncbi:MAG: exodeoxyribonuclease VII small subunit [Acidimicrobiales bacterium]